MINSLLLKLEDIETIWNTQDQFRVIAMEEQLKKVSDEIKSELLIALGVNLETFTIQDPKVILKTLTNYLYKIENLFLINYIELIEKETDLHIRLINLRIIIAATIKESINQSYVILSEREFNNLIYKLDIAEMRDMLRLGYKTRPPFRAKIFGNDKLNYFAAEEIESLISGIKKNIVKNESVEFISKVQVESIYNYSKWWWAQYTKYIDENYYSLRNKFKYYEGIRFKYVVSKSNIQAPTVEVSSKVCLIEMMEKDTNGLNIDIDEEIKEMYEIDSRVESCSITLGFKVEVGDMQDISHIAETINNELIEILSYLDSNKFIDEFINILLALYGYDKYKFDNYYFKRNLSDIKVEKVKLVRLNGDYSSNIDELRVLAKNRIEKETIVISSTVVPSSTKNKLRHIKNLIIVDIDTIIRSFKYKLNESAFSRILVSQILLPKLNEIILTGAGRNNVSLANSLISDLENCPKGSGWREYEGICYRAIRYLFEDNFSYFKAEYQLSNSIQTDIRDLIVANTGKHDFWKTVKQIYNSNNIVFEFKNYSQAIDNDALRQISDYLEKEVYGQFGVIFTRNNVSSSTKRKQRDYLHNRNKKLILVITDNILIDMIKIKKNNGIPEDVLFDLKFELETSI
ncbi:hypothetical protein P5G61_05505 [Paenibacillus sp. F6_3S_P_1C]|uniref:Restriction endonuclease type IV Mrr domain-containing protein n=1 Tax=Paenibacillus vandeheii TaxID=3035917 RepID=A0ABT8J6Y0_9BACL|nr:hypothetical protein [Paenibacillus vandeheii]MDN4600673.1 hypothetical protein [Paenibacillus vandeheii]